MKSGFWTGTLLLAALVVSACERAPAPPSAQATPEPVTEALHTLAAVCTAAGGKPISGETLQLADLNFDGRKDFVLDAGALHCDGAPGIYGDREKDVSVFIADENGGADIAYRNSAYGARIEGDGAATTLWLTVRGIECGTPPAPDFASETFCERPLTWNTAANTLAMAPVEAMRPIQ